MFLGLVQALLAVVSFIKRVPILVVTTSFPRQSLDCLLLPEEFADLGIYLVIGCSSKCPFKRRCSCISKLLFVLTAEFVGFVWNERALFVGVLTASDGESRCDVGLQSLARGPSYGSVHTKHRFRKIGNEMWSNYELIISAPKCPSMRPDTFPAVAGL